MVKELVDKIEAIEARARLIIAAAEKERIHLLNGARQKAESIIARAAESADAEAAELLLQARAAAQNDRQEIERRLAEDLRQLRARVTPKLKEAKKICR